MKFLKQASLAAAITAASFAAQAEMVALDDATMAATTGQSGVTIDVKLQAGTGTAAAIRVGGIDYTDDGQVNINDLWVGSANAITITQDIDVNDQGQLEIGVNAVSGLQVGIGSVHLSARSGAGTAADPYTYTQTGDSLVSNVNLNLDLGATTTTIGANSTYATADQVAAAGANTIVIDSATSLKINSSSLSALGGNITISDLTFDDNGNNAVIEQKIYADNNGVNIILESIQGDLKIGNIGIGGASIGSVTVSDIVMAGVTQTIRGHN